MANIEGTAGTSAEERRYCAIGICLHKILASGLRKVIAEEFHHWYNILTQPPTEIDKQVDGKYLKTLPGLRYPAHYENINGNLPKRRSAYDYAVKDPVSLAKLFLEPFMAEFTGFDETMDFSAVLAIMIEADPFVQCGATVHARRVTSDVRDEWARVNFSMWTNDKFNQAIDDMQSLVKSTNLSDAVKKEICDELQHWRDKESDKLWKWETVSMTHKEKFEKLIEHGQRRPNEILEVNGVRVCLKGDFLIAKGGQSNGVYIGLGTDGSEKAVKLFLKATHGHLAEKEKKLLTTCDTKELAHVVKYWFLDDKSSSTFAFLFMELCEETLEKFVNDNSLDLIKDAPDIIQQILKGLAGLHRKPNRILHRDLKPSNILRNVRGKWLLADFGIGRILPDDESTFEATQRGSKMWMAVESYDETVTSDDTKVPYKTESDIQVAGMVAFYILTKGQHPFGKVEQVRTNLLAANPVNLKMLDGHPLAKDLISWMLSHDPKDRPSAEEALQHPYLKSKEQQFKLLWGMWDYIKDKYERSDVVKELNKDKSDWRNRMDSDVYDYLTYDYIREESLGYNRSWKHCIRLIRNVKEHWKNYPKTPEKIKEGDYQKFFLDLFSDLVLRVFQIARSCDDLKELL